jgi:hypothetical protein
VEFILSRSFDLLRMTGRRRAQNDREAKDSGEGANGSGCL